MNRVRPLSVHYSSCSGRKNHKNSFNAELEPGSFRSKTHERPFHSIVRFKMNAKKQKQDRKRVSFQSESSEGNEKMEKRSKSKSKGKAFKFQSSTQLTQQNQAKIFQRTQQANRSQDIILSRPRAYKMYNRKFQGIEQCINPAFQEEQFLKYLDCFQHLFNKMNRIHLALQVQKRIKTIQPHICSYRDFIGENEIKMIDDFLKVVKDKRVWQTVRTCRIHEAMSVCYLFLEIAQKRFTDNQSYLINFIGFCSANIKLLTRLFLLIQKKKQFKMGVVQQNLNNWELQNFGHTLGNIEHIILRIQHNNQILSMIHKRLGRNNTRFQKYITRFMKVAERNNHPTRLCAHYIFEYLAMYIHEESESLLGISPSLEIAPSPFLAPASKQYTLIFEPVGIIKDINVKNISLRPYVMQFLKWAHKHFDVILWTWQMPSQIERLQQLFEPFLFSKLYRYHCIYQNEIYIKDLSRLGRNLQKTIIIDYDERIFQKTPNNGFVSRWKNRGKDQGLLVISQILQDMISHKSTVQEILTCYAEELRAVRG